MPEEEFSSRDLAHAFMLWCRSDICAGGTEEVVNAKSLYGRVLGLHKGIVNGYNRDFACGFELRVRNVARDVGV
jgi:hypothetical protein